MRLIDEMTNKQGEMTNIEKKVYDKILKDTRSFSLKSIGKVAEELEISKTSLVRFARRFGFKGYSEFKKILQEEEILDETPAGKLNNAMNNGYFYSLDEMKKKEIKNIHETFNKINTDDLYAFIQKVLKANSIYTMGWGISSVLADVLSFRLQFMGFKSFILDRSKVTLLEQIIQVKKDDLLIVFEFPNYVYEVLDAVKAAHKNGIDIVLVTDKENCPLIPYAKIIFFCSTKSQFFGNSLVGPLFFLNVVTSEILVNVKEKAVMALEEQKKVLFNDRYYIK